MLRRFRLPLLALTLLGVLVIGAACRHVGQGDLHVSNDLSGIGRDNTTFDAYAPDSGDVWPPAGNVNIFVKGDNFGSPPSYGLNSYMYLVRTNLACPQSEGAPEVFLLSNVTIVGVITITAGSANQFVTMADTPAARQSRFALMDIIETPNTSGGHLIHRCGTVNWTP